jgi:hypothetical protein
MESHLPIRKYQRIPERAPEVDHELPDARCREKDAWQEGRKERLLIAIEPHRPEKDGQ